MVQLGQAVLFVDARGVKHIALVTGIWAKTGRQERRGRRMIVESDELCPLNLVFVSGDEARYDIHGRQLERAQLVVHRSSQPAPGNYWCELSPVEPPRNLGQEVLSCQQQAT